MGWAGLLHGLGNPRTEAHRKGKATPKKGETEDLVHLGCVQREWITLRLSNTGNTNMSYRELASCECTIRIKFGSKTDIVFIKKVPNVRV